MSLFFYKKENNWVCVFCVLMAIVFCGLMIVSVVALFIPKFNIETKSILDFNTLLSVLSLTFVISIASPYFISKNQIRDEVRKYLENEYKNYVEKEVFTDKTKAFKREILNISSYKNEHKNLEKFLQSMNLF